MVVLRLNRDFLIKAEADDAGEDVFELSIASVEDFPMVFGDFFVLDGGLIWVEFRLELLAEDFSPCSSMMFSSVALFFFFRLSFLFC
jgi:hypothetical protein